VGYGVDLEEEAAALLLEADRVEQLDRTDLEQHLGPLVNRLLLRRGCYLSLCHINLGSIARRSG